MADDKKIIFSMVGVSKTFPPQKQVLKNIYLSFFYGAKIGIIGLNGSGKSTLLKIIAGLDKDYQGEVVFSPGYSVGYLEQDPHLEPGRTVKEIVQEGVRDGRPAQGIRGSQRTLWRPRSARKPGQNGRPDEPSGGATRPH